MDEDQNLIPISEAAKQLRVSIDTLRRWDKSGKLVAIRKNGGTHRYYSASELELVRSNLLELATEWAQEGSSIPEANYCPNRAVFQARLVTMGTALAKNEATKANFSLLVAVAGEIGNNSFDHNLGNWPDMPGVFIGYDPSLRRIVLADRGVGILKTLRRVRPTLTNDRDALQLAFSERISGRAPEARGNGLKFVRTVIAENNFKLLFRSGSAELWLGNGSSDLRIYRSTSSIPGCLASIEF